MAILPRTSEESFMSALTKITKFPSKAIDKVVRWYGSQSPVYRRYQNTLGPFVNNRYRRYCELCRETPIDDVGESAVRDAGSTLVSQVMSGERARGLSDQMTRLLEESAAKALGSQTQPMMKKLDRPVTRLGREIVDIFSSEVLDKQIRAFFGCHYRIQWLDCYRSFPTKQVSHSWLWHSDNVPIHTLKVMLHLTDAGERRGATKFMNFADTLAYYEAGYRGDLSKRKEDLESFAKQHELLYRPFSHDAKAGDVILFVNNALHKAVPPIDGYRDVLTFLLLPNPIPWNRQLEIDGIEQIEANPGGYPRNPARRRTNSTAH
jgi:hypothetical protein